VLTEGRVPSRGRDNLRNAIFLGNGTDLVDVVKGVAFKLLDRGAKHGAGRQQQPTAVLGKVPIAPGVFDGLLQMSLLLCRLGTGEKRVRGLPLAAFAPFEAHGST